MVARSLIPAVAYLRMSTDKQDKSIGDQLAEVRKYAARDGYSIVRWKEYVDEAISGNEDKREGFQRLIHDVRTIRDFDAVLCWSQDRFSRFDILDAAAYWKILRDADVALVTVCEGPIDFHSITGVLTASINQHGSNDYLKKLARGVTRGQESRARVGQWGRGLAPFGYRSAPDPSDPLHRRLVLDGENAEHVRRAFQAFVDRDCSLRDIAADFNRLGLKTVRGNDWTGQAVRGIFRNPVYLGRIVHGRMACGEHGRLIRGEYVAVRNGAKAVRQPVADCIVKADAHPAIVDQVTFDRVQAKIDGRATSKTKPRFKCSPISGMAYCAHCGRKCGAAKTVRRNLPPHYGLRCLSANDPTAKRRAKECRFCVNMAAVVAEVLAQVERDYLSDAQIDRVRQSVTDFLVDRRGLRAKADRENKAALEVVTRKLDKAEGRLADAPDDMLDTLYKQIRTLRDQQAAIQANLGTQARLADISERAVAEDGRAIVATLRGLRGKIREADPATVRHALAAMIERVDIVTEAVTTPLAGAARATKRRLQRVEITYRSPICTIGDIGPITLHCAEQLSSMKMHVLPNFPR